MSSVDWHTLVWSGLIVQHTTLIDLALLLNSLKNGLIGEYHGCVSDYSNVLFIFNSLIWTRLTSNFILLLASDRLDNAGDVE